SVTDALGRVTSYTYDALGNVTSVTRLAGTSGAVTTTMTYDPTFNQLTSITDPLNHTTSFGYDSAGNLTTVTDPLSHQTTLTYNAAGEPLTTTDPLGHTIQFAYDGGDLASVTDPLGNTSTRFVDAVGRLVSTTDPLGRHTRDDRDVLNRLTKVTDPLGNVTSFSYDPNGNLLSITDARNDTTTYTYDTMDRLASRTDPLQRTESYQYDANGNLSQSTDRKNQVTTFAYDALDRLTKVTDNDNSTTSYTYDAGDRTTRIVDSVSGTITPTSNHLDQLTQVTNPQGTVSYGYDPAGRRTSMTVAGQPAVAYSYDDANRLTQISQGTATVSFGYDAGNRRTSLTLPNGIAISYGYDQGSRLTGLTYTLGNNPLGDLSYSYDADGERLTMGGSFARTGLPQPVSAATYDQANELTQWGAATLTYDANGNLTNDGTNAYTWNARNQLASISGPSTVASFNYDAVGHRISKTINGTTTGFLYDGSNPVQELTGGTPSANLLTGLATDEDFTRTDSTGTATLLPDGLGSTTALANSSGTIQTQYTYDPFGNATSSGAASANSFQYTGRENDGTGLDYNRARYYSPTLQRFISEDPLGFGGGDANLYTYAGNDPITLTDPSGQFIQVLAPIAGACAGGAVVNVAVDVGVDVLGSRKVTVGGVARSAATGCMAGVIGLGVGWVVGPILGDVSVSAWALPPAIRGEMIEDTIGRSDFLVQNFPVIDRFEGGIATSIKSINLGDPYYQNPANLVRVLQRYAKVLADWQGATRAGYRVDAADITGRELIVAIPPGATAAQAAALQQVGGWAATIGVVLRAVVIR
ncbi:MAG: RHS repeat-associated core domain-containing protein, partial [Chloroflexota bacterium]